LPAADLPGSSPRHDAPRLHDALLCRCAGTSDPYCVIELTGHYDTLRRKKDDIVTTSTKTQQFKNEKPIAIQAAPSLLLELKELCALPTVHTKKDTAIYEWAESERFTARTGYLPKTLHPAWRLKVGAPFGSLREHALTDVLFVCRCP
jgi:hypothetical protein